MSDPKPDEPIDPTPLDHTPSEAPSGPARATVLLAEAAGTFLLVIAVIGTALFAAGAGLRADGGFLGVGFAGVALAAGFAVIAGAYAFGPISGGHFNPAVTLGLAAAGRFPWRSVLPYIVAQLVGGLVATTMLVLIGLFGPEGWLETAQDAGFASNGWGAASPSGFGLGAAAIVETLFTAIFVLVILGATHRTRGNAALAGVVIGLTLTVIHLVTIPIDNTSVNPARSLATAVYGGGQALGQLWVFLVFPLLGGLVGGLVYRALFEGTVATRARDGGR